MTFISGESRVSVSIFLAIATARIGVGLLATGAATATASLLTEGDLEPSYRLGEKLINNLFGAEVSQYADYAALRKEAESGEANACYKMGVLHDFGAEGVPTDYAQAETWYRRAINLDVPEAKHNLALLLLGQIDSLGQVSEFREAHQLLADAAETIPHSSLILGLLHLRGNLWLSPNTTQALHWLEKSASSDLPEAQYLLATILGNSEQYPALASPERSLDLLGASASQDYIPAQVELARVYLFGDGVERDLDKARSHYESAARSADPDAIFHLGEFAEHGLGNTEKNTEVAVKYYREAALAGHPEATAAIGRLVLHKKIPVPKLKTSESVAREWFEKAAEGGSQIAHLELADHLVAKRR